MKKKITLIALIITMLILPTTIVNANYQSIPTKNSKSEYASTWMTGIRKMEETGQVMGLNETINEDTLLSDISNNIDVHLLKNTEYGAIVLLGASNYGKQGTGENRYIDEGETTTTGKEVKASTTGNVSGIYEIGYSSMSTSSVGYEWVAGGLDNFLSEEIPNLAPRYINRYTDSEDSAKVGDATVEGGIKMGGWHGGNITWVTWRTPGFNRGNYAAFYVGTSYNTSGAYARAAVVSGTGF